MRSGHKLMAIFTIAMSSASLLAVQSAVAQGSPIDNITPVTDEMLLNPPDGDWLMWRRTYDGWGYSPLDQINKENVGDLQLAWAWSMTPGRTQENSAGPRRDPLHPERRPVDPSSRRGHRRPYLGV